MTQSDLGDLDGAIVDTEFWIVRGTDALLTFLDPVRSGFLRDTVSMDENNTRILGATSTNRSLVALLEAQRLLAGGIRGAERYPGLRWRVADALQLLVTGYYEQFATDPIEARESLANGVNMFTDSHLLLATTVLLAYAREPAPTVTVDRSVAESLRERCADLSSDMFSDLQWWKGGKVHADDNVHDFVTLHAVRAVDAVSWLTGRPVEWPGDLVSRVRRDVLLQLGAYSARLHSRFDPAELAFSIGVLYRLEAADRVPLIARTAEVLAETQAADGSWPTSKLISYSSERLLHVASFEIGLALANLVIAQLDHGDRAGAELLYPLLDRTFSLIRTTFDEADEFRGWSSDRARTPGLIESWATAVAVLFLDRYREVVLRLRQGWLLTRYETTSPVTASSPWPDLDTPLQSRTDADAEPGLLRVSDATAEGRLRPALAERFVRPVLQSVDARPPRAALLLHGPPGTRKATLARGLADALGWPMVALSPKDFLDQGGTAVLESRILDVFSDLRRLRRVVVFINGCEDVFRAAPRASGHAEVQPVRQLPASQLSHLLSHLAELRRENWVLVILSSRVPPERLDSASLQHLGVWFGHETNNPALPAQLRYVREQLPTGPQRDVVERVLTRFERVTGGADAETPVGLSFALLDGLLSRVVDDDDATEDAAFEVLRTLTDRAPTALIRRI